MKSDHSAQFYGLSPATFSCEFGPEVGGKSELSRGDVLPNESKKRESKGVEGGHEEVAIISHGVSAK